MYYLLLKDFYPYLDSKKTFHEENMEQEIFQMADKYDENFNKVYDWEEFKNFANKIGVKQDLLLLDVDLNDDGIITRDEILHFLKSKTSSEQFSGLFKKFAININNKEVITPVQWKNFFIKYKLKKYAI